MIANYRRARPGKPITWIQQPATNGQLIETTADWSPVTSLLADSFNSPGFAADDDDRGHRAAARLALPAPIARRWHRNPRHAAIGAHDFTRSVRRMGRSSFTEGTCAMTVRLLASLAVVLSSAASLVAQEGQTVTAGCNCPKCQAIRQAAELNQATYNAMPAGLFAAPAQVNEVQTASNETPANGNAQAGFHHHAGAMPAANCPPGGGYGPGYGVGPAGYGPNYPGYVPYGWNYPYGHPGRIFTGGSYGPYGGAHGTPGYPRHMHMHREYVGPQGPPTANVAYPYYTIRGPRDFLIDNPPSIGR
jgi:hypothetical protein